ncbi:MAG TPA: methylmalonyl-CoA mutase family protein, partial [Vicinamibacterales bacterium]
APVKKPDKAEPAEPRTISGIPLETVYGPQHLADRGWTYAEKLGDPGQYPYTRGPHQTMYRGKPWTMRMFAGFGTPEDTNQRFKFLLANGQTGLSTAFDMPTLMGYDPDHARSLGEVGREGVSVATLDDMMRLFGDIPLDKVSTSMTINAPAAVLLALYVAVAEKQGVAPDKLRGTLQNDMLKEFIAQKEWISPIRGHMRIIRDMLVWCTRTMPQWNTISISGYHIREAGSTAAQEVAFTLANAIAYVVAARDAGLDPNTFGERLSFFFNCHNNFIEEVAKFRAARRLWARLMRDRFGVTSPRAQQLRFHAQTAGSTLTARQPDNNIVRVAIQALAAVLGGTQSLHCNGRDEALSLPTEESARIALRTQQIIAAESGVANTVDPVAGAYTFECETDRIEAEALTIIERIDRLGGMLAAIEAGVVQREIQDSAYRAQQAIESGDAVIVGVNRYQDEAPPIEVFQLNPEVEARQRERLRAVRAGRSEQTWRQAIADVEAAAADGRNLVPPILAAVEAHATVGEIADAMRRVFGEYEGAAEI